MLSNHYLGQSESLCSAPTVPEVYKRDFKKDMKDALDLLFNFKEDLDKLHPECSKQISKLLQERFY